LSRALVTGAAGFVGSRLVPSLRADGQQVRALVRPQHDTRVLEAAGVEVVRGDASDLATLTAAADGCEVVYHLAAARGARKLGARAYRERNRRLSESAGRGSLAAGVRRLVWTSVATLTGYDGPERQNEDTRALPNSAYRLSRLVDEQIFDELARRDGLDVVTARLPRVLGPGARDWARTVRAVRDGSIRVLPEGGTFHSGDVDDIVDALKRCAQAPGIAGRRFVLSAVDPVPTVALLRTFADCLGVPFAPRIVPAAPYRAYVALGNFLFRSMGVSLPYHYTAEFYSARLAFDVTRARRELGWTPGIPLLESARRTAIWLREMRLV
jgi:dihydroflavonol-4-reductase